MEVTNLGKTLESNLIFLAFDGTDPILMLAISDKFCDPSFIIDILKSVTTWS